MADSLYFGGLLAIVSLNRFNNRVLASLWPRHSSLGVSLVGGRARKGAIDDMDEMKDPRVPEGMRAVILIGPGVLRLCRVTSHETAVDKDFFARLAM